MAVHTRAHAIQWRAGDPERFRSLEPLLHDLATGRGGEALEILRDKPGRRRLARVVLPSGEVCFLKLHHASGGRRARRRALQRALGLTTPTLEFATLRRLRAAGVAVPEPLAHARLPDGDEVVVTRFLDGCSLPHALDRPPPERIALLRAVGALVARLHDAGTVHRDLHAENVWVTREGPVLIDLQAALPVRAPWLRRRDRGELDRSLAARLSLADRVRLRAALLGVERPFSPAARRGLRAIGAASHARAVAHAESRTRRSLYPGRLYTRWRRGGATGMRLRRADEARLLRALEGADEGLEVVRFPAPAVPGLPGRRSPARRGWLAGHGLRARGIGARRPLAFLEERGGASCLVLERAAETPAAASPDEIRRLGLALARFGVRHERMRALPLCRARDGTLCVDALHAVSLPHRRRGRALRAIDAFVAAALAEAPGSPEARESARRRYRRERRFLPGGGGGAGARRGEAQESGRGRPSLHGPPQPRGRRPPDSDAASSSPQLDASRGSSSHT